MRFPFRFRISLHIARYASPHVFIFFLFTLSLFGISCIAANATHELRKSPAGRPEIADLVASSDNSGSYFLDRTNFQIVNADSLLDRFRIFAAAAVRPRDLVGLSEAWFLPLEIADPESAKRQMFDVISLTDLPEYFFLIQSSNARSLLIKMDLQVCGRSLGYNECARRIAHGLPDLAVRFTGENAPRTGVVFREKTPELQLVRILIDDVEFEQATPPPARNEPERRSIGDAIEDFLLSLGGGSGGGLPGHDRRGGGSGSR